MLLKCANQLCCPQLTEHHPHFLCPQATRHTLSQTNPEIGWNNHIFLPLLPVPLLKSIQISEVAQKFPCCIIMKTSDERKELFKNCPYRLTVKRQVLIHREQRGGVLYKHVHDKELSLQWPGGPLSKKRTYTEKKGNHFSLCVNMLTLPGYFLLFNEKNWPLINTGQEFKGYGSTEEVLFFKQMTVLDNIFPSALRFITLLLGENSSPEYYEILKSLFIKDALDHICINWRYIRCWRLEAIVTVSLSPKETSQRGETVLISHPKSIH